ncbi:MAG: hypothetical protein V4621_07630 [Pseudomonadota bacterium]
MFIFKIVPLLLSHAALIQFSMTAAFPEIGAAQSHDRRVTGFQSPAFSKSQLIAMGGLSPASYSAVNTVQQPNSSK